jgi:phosphinothricin acetyltransferase
MSSLIRLATAADAEQVAAIYAPFVRDTPVSFEVEPPDAAEMGRRMALVMERFAWLVCDRGGEVLGYVYASAHRDRAAYQWSADVTAYNRLDCRRRGLGRALYTALLRLLVLQGHANAYAGITLPNPGSVGLHEAVGFVPVGVYRKVGYKFGAWHDVGWWQLRLQELPEPLPPPRPAPDLYGSPGWAEALAAGQALLRV